MADQKVSDLPALNGADVDAADLLYIVDSSAGSAGSKKITVGQYQLAPVSGGTANGVLYLNASKVATAGSDLVFDGSNLGLGVTPSAWGTGFKAAQIDTQSAVTGSGTNTYLSANWYFTTSDRYITNGLATIYRQNAGQHIWYNAPNNTSGAGAAAAFTQAMTLDASGNLLVGTTTASGGRATITAVANYGDLATGYSLVLSNIAGTGSNSNPINVGLIQFGNPTITNNDLGRLSVVQENPGSGTQSSMRFFTNGGGGNAQTLERARITSGGDLLVGTTTVGAGLTDGFSLQMGGGASQIHIGHTSGIGSGELYAGFSRGGTTIGSISQNGTTAVLFNTTSDRRLKENIAPAPSASDVIDAIEIVSHDWKSAPDEHVTYGVIAQDLALVAPQAVLQGDDGDEIEKTWGVDYSKLVPMLIKEIQSLRARVAALEAQP